MSNFTRKLHRNQRRKSAKQTQEVVQYTDQVLNQDEKKLPSGKVTTSPVKGEFTTFPLLGWVAVRAKEEIPLVMLLLALMKDNQMRGILQMELPVYKDTEFATLAFLERFGWQGQIWRPGDEGWPTGDAINEDQLSTLIATSGLTASMIFPPDSGNNLAQPIEVMRASGPFLIPPLPEPATDPAPKRLEALRKLCADPKGFFNKV